MKEFPYAYIRKKIVKSKDATVPVQCKALQYGLGCFSGIRGFWNAKDKNIYLFRPDDHFYRLQESAKILGMKLNYTYPKFLELLKKLIKKNKAKGDIYIRPTLYAASTKLTPRFDNADDDLAVYMIALKDYFKKYPDNPIYLYVHIPYCAKLCYYCSCNMHISNNRDKIKHFVGFLLKECEMLERFFQKNKSYFDLMSHELIRASN